MTLALSTITAPFIALTVSNWPGHRPTVVAFVFLCALVFPFARIKDDDGIAVPT
jgi:hypothetical protein